LLYVTSAARCNPESGAVFSFSNFSEKKDQNIMSTNKKPVQIIEDCSLSIDISDKNRVRAFSLKRPNRPSSTASMRFSLMVL